MVSVDVKQHSTNHSNDLPSLISLMVSVDIKHHEGRNSNDFGFTCAGRGSNVASYERNA